LRFALIDAGVEILNPVQTSARYMEPERLKREFGRDVTFWGGGCDTQMVLPGATPQQVREHVRRRLEILMPGGGFVFSQVHNVMADVPPENVVAMLEAPSNSAATERPPPSLGQVTGRRLVRRKTLIRRCAGRHTGLG